MNILVNGIYTHNCTGNSYKCLGIINHKDEETREWVDHVLYEGEEIGVKYSRTVSDFQNNFTELKL
jgi:hypothetical protein